MSNRADLYRHKRVNPLAVAIGTGGHELLNYPALNADANLVAYYRMEGNPNDHKGSFNGSNHGAVFGVANGKFGQGAAFNGASYIFTPMIMTAVTNITIMCWVYLSSTSLKGTFWDVGSVASNNVRYGLGVGSTTFDNNGNNLIFLLEALAFVPTTRAIGTGWHLVGIQRVTTYWNTILDGVLVATASQQAPVSGGDAVVIGADHPGYAAKERFFTGSIDELTFWTRALSAAEIWDYYTWATG